MTTRKGIATMERRIVRAHTTIRLDQIAESLSNEYASDPEIKRLLTQQRKDILK